MLTLITGQPGNGKTLHALWLVEKLRKESGREVFVTGINECTLPWRAFADGREWCDQPDNSIVVIDEAWKAFPTRRQGAAVPEYVEKLATHRHRGLDVFLITQSRLQLDTFVRGLVGRHIDVVRRFGRNQATLYQWEKVSDPTNDQARRDALKTVWKYPREVFDWYKSAEMHTVRRDFPMRKMVGFGVLAVVVIGAIGFGAYRVMNPAVPRGAVAPARAPGVVLRVAESSSSEIWSAPRRAARVRNVPQSAPLYDDLQSRIETAPAVLGCMALDREGGTLECRCTGPGGVVLADVSTSACREMVRFGWFDPTRSYEDVAAVNRSYLDQRDGASGSASGAAPSGIRVDPVSPVGGVQSLDGGS
jgi:zona occludens toxin